MFAFDEGLPSGNRASLHFCGSLPVLSLIEGPALPALFIPSAAEGSEVEESKTEGSSNPNLPKSSCNLRIIWYSKYLLKKFQL